MFVLRDLLGLQCLDDSLVLFSAQIIFQVVNMIHDFEFDNETDMYATPSRTALRAFLRASSYIAFFLIVNAFCLLELLVVLRSIYGAYKSEG